MFPVAAQCLTRCSLVCGVVLLALAGAATIDKVVAADESARVTHPDIIAKYPWVRDLGQGWVRSSGQRRYPPNQIPMFGGFEKTDGMLEADRTYRERIASMASTAREGAQKLTVLGFRYFAQRDMVTAIKRFNQAWLIDPGFGDVYHGFALVVIERDRDAVTSERLFKIATGIDNTGPRAFADYGRLLLIQKRYKEAVPVLRRATEKGPDLESAHAWLGVALYRSGNTVEACDYIASLTVKQENTEKREQLMKTMNCAAQ